MKVTTALDSVLPQSSVLWKDSGLWSFYRSDDDFIAGKEYLYQLCTESFEEFINRVIQALMKEEADNNDPEPLVTIDYAIYNKQ
jgi:hypothetical protein